LCPREKFEHVLRVDIAGNPGLGTGKTGLGRGHGEAHAVLHKLEGSLQDILAVVQKVL
jgi:hypothetical protein